MTAQAGLLHQSFPCTAEPVHTWRPGSLGSRRPRAPSSANKRTAHGQPVHSFATLLTDLANLTCDTVRFDNALPVTVLSKPTPVQQRVFHLLGLNLAGTQKR